MNIRENEGITLQIVTRLTCFCWTASLTDTVQGSTDHCSEQERHVLGSQPSVILLSKSVGNSVSWALWKNTPDIRCYGTQSQVHYRQQVFFRVLMGLGPCELEAVTGLFHLVERDLLLTVSNSDRSTCGKTMAPVKVEHSSRAHRCLCCSFRWLPCSHSLAEHASPLPFRQN